MKVAFYTPIYAFTLLISAVLLFSIQPLFSKMILPLLGGTPAVWNTAMLFFQIMLLAGYAYAHGTSKLLGIRAQAALHLILLVIFVAALPIAIPEGWTPPTDKDPTLWQLSLMSVKVGGPFFVLAASAPMLQHWFSHTDHPDAHNPYFLYGASNLGSMTALLAYPVLIEPSLTLNGQSYIWMIGYFALMVMIFLSAFLVWTHKTTNDAADEISGKQDAYSISWHRRFQWILLAFLPSSLMLGVTTIITTDIASVPLLWIVPLTLYISTFIIVFARKPVMSRNLIALLQALSVIALTGLLMTGLIINPFFVVLLHITTFFFTALLCHTELAALRPKSSHLTEFYLLMSLGGALGGFFNAIIAPVVLVIPLEYAIVLAASCFMRFASDNKKIDFSDLGKKNLISLCFYAALLLIISTIFIKGKLIGIPAFISILCMSLLMEKRLLFGSLIALILILHPPGYGWEDPSKAKVILRERNFFGVIKLVDIKKPPQRLIYHGTTMHGLQSLLPEHKKELLSYYGGISPIKDVFRYFDGFQNNQNVAIIGLGSGNGVCFSHEGRKFDLYEIDKDIAAIAENPKFFTFLSDCGSPYKIILGDGRLKIDKKENNNYDIVWLDAFSSDTIPIHLITKEAVSIYLGKLKYDGVLLFHISNRFLDIEPVLSQIAKSIDIPTLAKYAPSVKIKGSPYYSQQSHWFIMTRSEDALAYFKENGWTAGRFRKGVGLWTDQFSNIVSVLGNKTGFGRAREYEIKKAREKRKKKLLEQKEKQEQRQEQEQKQENHD